MSLTLLIDKIKNLISNNKNIFINILGAYGVKGFSILLSLFAIPAYMKFFDNAVVLGVWYTILSLVTWVFMFDLGIGHGLRNKLVIALVDKNEKLAKKYISSAYFTIGAITLIISIILFFVIKFSNFNSILNISSDLVSNQRLQNTLIIMLIGIMMQFELKLINSILFALQKPAINNLLNLLSNLIIFLFLIFGKNYGDSRNLLMLAIVNSLAINIPLLITSFIIFSRYLEKMKPSIKFVNKVSTKEIMNIGLILLWLQIIWMVISSMHPILISKLINPQAVVEYQLYLKIFTTISSIVILALIPIWSAVTKALLEKRLDWIKNTYKLLLLITIFTFIICILIVPILQFIFNLWLGDQTIIVDRSLAFSMVIFSTIFVLHNVNTSISNGMSWFKVQFIWMTIAASLMIPLSIILSNFLGNWTGVIYASVLSILPYEIIQPLLFKNHLKKIENSNQEIA